MTRVMYQMKLPKTFEGLLWRSWAADLESNIGCRCCFPSQLPRIARWGHVPNEVALRQPHLVHDPTERSGQLTWRLLSKSAVQDRPVKRLRAGIACLQHALFSCPCNVSMAVCVLKSASSLPGSGYGDADAVKRLRGKPFRGTCSLSAMCHASSQTCAADWARKVQLHVAVRAI